MCFPLTRRGRQSLDTSRYRSLIWYTPPGIMNRTPDLSDLEIVGETIENVAMNLEYAFAYTEDGTLPAPMAKMGIKGLVISEVRLESVHVLFRDHGRCALGHSLRMERATVGRREILSGKMMKPTPGRKNTILMGKCMYVANKNNPDIKNMIAVKTCPPSPEAVVKALRQAGIEVSPEILKTRDKQWELHEAIQRQAGVRRIPVQNRLTGRKIQNFMPGKLSEAVLPPSTGRA